MQRGGEATILTTETANWRGSTREGVRFEYIRPIKLSDHGSARIRFLIPRIQFFISRQPIFRELLHEERVDLVHEDISPFPSYYPNELCRRFQVPHAALVHQLQGNLPDWVRNYGLLGIPGSIGELALRRGWVRYSRVITDSAWMKDSLSNDLSPEKVTWIPNGVDSDDFRPGSGPGSIEEQEERLEFLCVGRFLGWKGHRTLLRSFARFLSKDDQARLTMVGTGPEFKTTKAYARQLGILSDVRFLGWVSHEEMPHLYRQMNVFILPSIGTEGLSVALLEAMSSGLPIIASDVIGNRAVLDPSNAILVAAGDETALADAMLSLSEDEFRRKELGGAGRSKAIEMFSWDRVVEREIELFRECVREGAHSHTA